MPGIDAHLRPERALTLTGIRTEDAWQEIPRSDGAAPPEDLIQYRREAVKVLLTALESGSQSVIDVASAWCAARLKDGVDPFIQIEDPSAEICVAAEIRILGPRLHMLYFDPRQFFREAARDYPEAFDVDRWPYKLGNLLFTWGVAVLLSPPVYAAFSRLPESLRNKVLAEAEGRVMFAEGGRPRGSSKVTGPEIAATHLESVQYIEGESRESLRADRTIYPEADEKGKPKRKRTSPQAAALNRTAVDEGLSVRTVKRKLGKKKRS